MADWKGLNPAPVTLFKDNGDVDFEANARLAKWLASIDGVKSLVILGHAGEGTFLTHDEQLELIRVYKDATPLPVVAGITGEGTRVAYEEAKQKYDAGATAALTSAGAKGFAFTEALPPEVKTGTSGADLFDATEAGGVFTGGGGRDLFLLEEGDGHVTVTDFASRTDKLVFMDLDAADVSSAAATQGGVAGLLVSYGDTGTVFLAGVTSLAARDMAFG